MHCCMCFCVQLDWLSFPEMCFSYKDRQPRAAYGSNIACVCVCVCVCVYLVVWGLYVCVCLQGLCLGGGMCYTDFGLLDYLD